MPSPFPGMDPYLEHPGWWPDFHHEMISCCRTALLRALPPGYYARVEERFRVVGEPAAGIHRIQERHRVPDVSVTRDDLGWRPPQIGTAAVATLEAVSVEVPMIDAEEPEHWIEVLHLEDEDVVTALELLSPYNKAGTGWREYQQKRRDYLRAGVHLVEIDLLLKGRRPDHASLLPACDYCALITRKEEPQRREVYHWQLEDPLPTVPVPLDAPDPDVGLNLAAAFAEAYERGGYARGLRYYRPAEAVDEGRRGWVADLLKSGAAADA